MRRISTLRRLRPGSEPVNIRQLISPLRYDVIVRAQFFADLRRRRRDPQEPTASLREFALEQPYFMWFKYVETARFFPQFLDNPDQLLDRFFLRVDRAVATLRSYDSRGFDAQHPVTLAHTPGGTVSDSGLRLSNSLHIRDGCHRLALLLLDGGLLQPQMYRTHSVSAPLPDNTALLLPHLDLGSVEYANFLAPAFTTTEHGELSDLRTEVAERSPARLQEFDDVVATHDKARHHAV
jgi:hypothetical protein